MRTPWQVFTSSTIRILQALNAAVRRLSAVTHGLQYRTEGLLRGSTEWFDHYLDAHWQWPFRGNSLFLERGVLNLLVVSPGAAVLELCCGDGFNARHFYAHRAARVVAADRNSAALAHARRRNSARNIDYVYCDLTVEMPSGVFDNVIWDAAMQHFSDEEIDRIVAGAHAVLCPGGVLSGCTEIERVDIKYDYTKTVFTGPEDIAGRLREFAHVIVIEQPAPTRRLFYFFASDDRGRIPFVTAGAV